MPKNKRLYTVSNAHLDTQWNWTIQDTIRDCVKNTLVQNFALLERYSNYRFNFEGAFRYKLAKEYYPHLYEKLKEYVKAGRWNVAGSSWDACDANVPSSEAFMRQILLGNGYWEREFGKTSLDIFLPDCFGFRYALPSIAYHMGLKGFSTQKLVWGVGMPIVEEDGTLSRPMPDDKKPRADLCRWTGPDGNTILCSLDEGGYTYNFEYSGDTPINQREHHLHEIERNEKIAGVPSRSMYYGAGDYGGSPTDTAAKMVNEAVADTEGGLFQVLSASSDDIFRDLSEEEIEKIPAYRGNLLIPHGYGAMVSHTISKRWNRKNELLADSAERADSMAAWLGTEKYPKERLRDAWETFLWHQFHDDVTGTSIGDAYTFSYNDYVIALNTFASELTAGVDGIVRTLRTDVTGTPVAVFNPISSARTDVVTAKLSAKSAYVRVYDADGNEVPSQCRQNGDSTLTVTFTASVAPVSCTVFDVRESDAPCALRTAVSVTEDTLKNDRYTVRIDKNGDISSIVDHTLGNRELLSAPIQLQLMPDTIPGEYPAWEYLYEDFGKPYDTVAATPTVEIVENGPAAAALKITRVYRGTTYEQTVSLYAGGNRVDVDNRVLWYTRESMLRAAFPFTASSPKVVLDQGLGAEECENSTTFPYYQYNVHQWADLNDRGGDFGVTLMNDCKYSIDKPDDNMLRLTLIRTPKGGFSERSSQDFQDMGLNLFRYSVTSHGADYSGRAAEAEAVNQPLKAFVTGKHPGTGASLSFVRSSHKEILVRCLKQEEKGDRLIVRVQETSGKEVKGASLTFAADILSAVETNGYETATGSAAYENDTLSFDMIPYGVRTFALTLKKPSVRAEGKRQTVLPLFYTKKTVTPMELTTEGELARGVSIPAELYEENITAGGVRFALGPIYGYNAVESAGQKIAIPQGTETVYILASSAAGDKKAEFLIDEKPYTVSVADCMENVGAWDLIVTGAHCVVKHDEIAVRYTHTHDKDGDRLYEFAYIFKYAIPVRGASVLTLPSDADILVFAATAEEGDKTDAVAPLYDSVDTESQTLYRLTVNGASAGSGMYAAGRPVILRTEQILDGGLFESWQGEAISWQDGRKALLVMPAHDTEVTAVRRYIGHNVLEGKAPSANHCIAGEEPDNALSENDFRKWCGKADENGCAWLEVDLGKMTKIDGWLVRHAGVRESEEWNTADFRLEYRADEKDDWKVADSVSDNRESVTLRDFAPVDARYIRLYVTKPTHDGNEFCRIYNLQVLSK